MADIYVIVAWATAIQVSLALMLGFALLVVTASHIRRTRATRNLIPRARHAIALCLAGVGTSGEATEFLRALPIEERFEVIRHAAESVASGQTSTVLEIAEGSGLLALAKGWQRSRLPWLRLRGARVLALVDPEANAAERAVQDSNKTVANLGLELVGNERSASLVEAALRQLESPSGSGWLKAQEALYRLSPVAELRTFIAEHQGRPLARALAVAAAIREPELLEAAAKHVKDPEPSARVELAHLASTIGSRTATLVLQRLVVDPAPAVRVAAIEAMALLGRRDEIAAMAARLGDEEYVVRQSAVAGLMALGLPGRHTLESAANGPSADLIREALRWESVEMSR